MNWAMLEGRILQKGINGFSGFGRSCLLKRILTDPDGFTL